MLAWPAQHVTRESQCGHGILILNKVSVEHSYHDLDGSLCK